MLYHCTAVGWPADYTDRESYLGNLTHNLNSFGNIFYRGLNNDKMFFIFNQVCLCTEFSYITIFFGVLLVFRQYISQLAFWTYNTLILLGTMLMVVLPCQSLREFTDKWRTAPSGCRLSDHVFRICESACKAAIIISAIYKRPEMQYFGYCPTEGQKLSRSGLLLPLLNVLVTVGS